MDFEVFLHTNKIILRPNAGFGAWLLLLLPLAVLKSCCNLIFLTPTYKLTAIQCVGILIATVLILHKRNVAIKLALEAVLITLLLIIYTENVFLATISGVLCTFGYQKVLRNVFLGFPQSFTLGEGILVGQAVTLFLHGFILSFIHPPNPVNNLQVATTIIQFGLLGIGALGIIESRFKDHTNFYIRAILCIFLFILLPLHVILKCSPILWILQQLFNDLQTIKLILYWSTCSAVAVIAINKQIANAKRASTVTRKTFHLLAFAVYLPGLLYNFSLLYLASGVVLGIFLALEILRIFQIPPFGVPLQEGFLVYRDEKDVGVIAMTPIYLLVGCSLPLWIHPSPSDVTNSALFQLIPLLSGLLTVGIGDTCASLVGSRWGRHKWTGSSKSIEGTLACCFSQILVIFALNLSGLVHVNQLVLVKIIVGIVVTSIVEAKTDQVDNLVLPLIMYTIVV